MKATIYIPDDQAKIYEDAKEKLGESISKTFVKCLERELENAKLKMNRMVVEVCDQDTGRTAKKAFEGRFVVGSPDASEKFYFDASTDGGTGCGCYAVAVTKANRLVVLGFKDEDWVTSFTVYNDFDEFANEEYPKSLVQSVASELDIEHIENLDI